jgi:glycerol-3-phosphate dehydrogenase
MNPTVLILGAGINGAAIARELLLNGVSVWMVEQTDICYGATAYSSRLVHGGLRYLEFGEFDLVRESLAERTRLLQLAPQFVRPLQLFIPVRNRARGWLSAAARFLRMPLASRAPERGLWLIRTGLWFYDRYARDRSLPHHHVLSLSENGAPPVNSDVYRWLCAYYDAQITFPERFVQALLSDAKQLAAEQGLEFRVLTRNSARLAGLVAKIAPTKGQGSREAILEPTQEELVLQPAAVINATGAWVDQTLERLPIAAERLMGGTKGSHLFTFHEPLRAALSAGGIYTEAADGRPVFLLPLAGGVLIGTTDLPFQGDPADAVANETEIVYLLACVNHVFPKVTMEAEHIAWHYSGVRPLPWVDAQSTAAITRRHGLKEHSQTPLPVFSVVGGKLTTCRSLAEETALAVLKKLGLPVVQNSQARVIPGSSEYLPDDAMRQTAIDAFAQLNQLTFEQGRGLWNLWGSMAHDVARYCHGAGSKPLAGTNLPCGAAKYAIEHEWATTLDDLVERRLMLLYEPGISLETLSDLADELVAAGMLTSDQRNEAIESTCNRLQSHFGLSLRKKSALNASS